MVFGFVQAAVDGWAEKITLGAFATGLVLLSAFVVTERRVSSPITALRLFTDRNRVTSYVARLLMVAGMLGMFFFLTQFLQSVLGYSALATGLAFLPLTVMLFTSSQLASRLSGDRISPRAQIAVGLSISTVGLLSLSQLSEHSSYLSVLGPLMMFGLGNGMAFVPLTLTALAGVEARDLDDGR